RSGANLVLSGGGTFDIGAQSQTIGSLSGTSGNINLGGGALGATGTITVGSGLRILGMGTVQASVDGVGQLLAAGGLLEFTAAVDATTASDISIGATTGSVLKFDSTVGTAAVNPSVTFLGGNGLLDLSATTLGNFHGVLAGFATGEGIKVANAASATL